MSVTYDDVLKARDNVYTNAKKTPLLRAEMLDEVVNAQVYLKPENLQTTGSFKIRGATNCIMSLTDEEKKLGVIAASSGNHAQAVAYAAGKLDIKATIVMPENAPEVKVTNTIAYGAKVIKCGFTGQDRDQKVAELIEKHGYCLVHSHADPRIIAGQGTVGLEIMEDESDFDAVVLPCGAGGLIAGSSLAIKNVNSKVKVIGVEPDGVPRYRKSRESKQPLTVEMGETIADGLRVSKAAVLNFGIIEKYVDDLVSVSDKYIEKAMKEIILKSKLLIEPSAAVGIAAAMEGKIKFADNTRICFVLSGGNVSESMINEILQTK